jgi:Cu/Ag efflux protein CusF
VKYDETGHIHTVSTHTVTMPEGSLKDEKVATATANVLTNIDFDATSGKISVKHDNAANLLLTDLTAIKSDSNWI